MARLGVVIDRHGSVVDDDDDVVRDGQVLRVPLALMDGMDGTQKAVMRDAAQRRRVCDSYLRMKDRLSHGMHRHRVPTRRPDAVADGEAFDHRHAAYDALKRRLSRPVKAKRQRKPVDPAWGRP